MDIVAVLVLVLVLGLVLRVFEEQIPVPGWVKSVVRTLVILIIVIWLLQAIGVAGLPHIYLYPQ